MMLIRRVLLSILAAAAAEFGFWFASQTHCGSPCTIFEGPCPRILQTACNLYSPGRIAIGVTVIAAALAMITLTWMPIRRKNARDQLRFNMPV